MRTLAELATEYGAIKAKITELNKQLAELQQQKDESSRLVMAEMAAQGVKSANLPHIGKLTIRESKYYKITDPDLFARTCLSSLVEAGKDGRPWADGVLYQQRVSAEMLEAWCVANKMNIEELSSIGIQRATREDLSFSVARN